MIFSIYANKMKCADIVCGITYEAGEAFVYINTILDIRHYSLILLDLPIDLQESFIDDFTEISNLSDWLWDTFFGLDKNTIERFDDVLSNLYRILSVIVDKYKLSILIDTDFLRTK
jgi:hypothetical protein